MRCVTCDTRKECQRAVLAVGDGTLEGGYCRSCEAEHFGVILDSGRFEGDARCLLCRNRGTFAIALREIEYIETPNGEVRHETYPVDGETPRLCPTHLEEVLGVDVDTDTEQQRLPDVTPRLQAPLD